MTAELQVEIARVAKLASEAQHAASAAALMGGSTKRFVERRDALLAKLRSASLAMAEADADACERSLTELRAETE